MPAKKSNPAIAAYRVRILAPDSATKWVPTQSLAIEVEELKTKSARAKRTKSPKAASPGHAEAA